MSTGASLDGRAGSTRAAPVRPLGGNSRVRTRMVELAWLWLRYQPQSQLARWYRRRFAKGGPRADTADTSPSGREWGWVCGALEAGAHPRVVYQHLVERARLRRGGDAERYARRTVTQALRRTCRERRDQARTSPAR